MYRQPGGTRSDTHINYNMNRMGCIDYLYRQPSRDAPVHLQAMSRYAWRSISYLNLLVQATSRDPLRYSTETDNREQNNDGDKEN